ncbi:MAG TPA: hypothetical protein VF951_13120 [Streptosporangiaceae bacterium]
MLAAGLGISRASVYRWFGSREGLVREALASEFRELLDRCAADVGGRGTQRLLDTLTLLCGRLARNEPMRRYLVQEQANALRLLTSHARAGAAGGRRRDDRTDRAGDADRRLRPVG